MLRKFVLGALSIGLLLFSFAYSALPADASLKTITINVNGQEVTVPADSTSSNETSTTTTPTTTTPTTTTPAPEEPATQPDPKPKPKTPKKKSPGQFIDKDKAKDKVKGKKPKSKKKSKKNKSQKDDADDKAKDKAEEDAAVDELGLGAAPVGVPNFVINRFRIPPFLIPIYQAAGSQYGIRWEVLAAINEVETDYGRNLNVSTAGALGWMQFMPGTWASYGVDANEDGIKDPYNPVDAIFAAARYLKASGYSESIRQAIFSYNHANWYVDMVIERARAIAGMPTDLVSSLTGLTQGRFPIYATARYADNLTPKQARRLNRRTRESSNAAKIVSESSGRRAIDIFSREDAPVVAANDGVIRAIGKSKRLGNYVVLEDIYGNRFTYAHLAKLSKNHPVPRKLDQVNGKDEFHSASDARKRSKAAKRAKTTAQAGKEVAKVDELPKATNTTATGRPKKKVTENSAYVPSEGDLLAGESGKERLFANPSRSANRELIEDTGQSIDGEALEEFKLYFAKVLKLSPKEMKLKPLEKGSKVIGGTVLGRIGQLAEGPGSELEPHVNFSIRPAGRKAPRIDPKPILDGWKLLEATALYRAAGKNPFVGPESGDPSPGQVLLMPKEALVQRVLNNRKIEIYPCGRDDIRTGQVDRRVLALLEFLASSGLRPTVTSLGCGHSFYTAGGGVSDHPFGRAVDIAAINGIPIYGNQGPGSITETTIRKMLTLQGTARPYQIISLMDMGGPTFVLSDHADHIHVGFESTGAGNPAARLSKQARAVLSPNQWDEFVSRLTNIDNPAVSTQPSPYSLKAKPKRKRDRSGRN